MNQIILLYRISIASEISPGWDIPLRWDIPPHMKRPLFIKRGAKVSSNVEGFLKVSYYKIQLYNRAKFVSYYKMQLHQKEIILLQDTVTDFSI